MNDDAKRWDATHKRTYQENRGPSDYAVEKEKFFPRGSLVVELGGGTGEDALYFLQQGHSVVILDISEFALKLAKEKAGAEGFTKQLVVKQVDFGLHQLPIKDGSVDIAYSRISLNYFGSNHTTKLYQDIYKMLKIGGSAFLTFKSPDDVEEMEHLANTGVLYEDNVYIDNGQLRSRFTVEQHKIMLDSAGIVGFQVNPYQEQLKEVETGHENILYSTEVTFSKT